MLQLELIWIISHFQLYNRHIDIGAGACNGPFACANLEEDDTYHVIADNSCIGNQVCTNNVGNISMEAWYVEYANFCRAYFRCRLKSINPLVNP